MAGVRASSYVQPPNRYDHLAGYPKESPECENYQNRTIGVYKLTTDVSIDPPSIGTTAKPGRCVTVCVQVGKYIPRFGKGLQEHYPIEHNRKFQSSV